MPAACSTAADGRSAGVGGPWEWLWLWLWARQYCMLWEAGIKAARHMRLAPILTTSASTCLPPFLPRPAPPLLPTPTGSNAANQLGVDSGTQAYSPYPVVVDDALEFSRVAAGDTFSCGLLLNSSAVCWGGYGDAGLTQLLPPAPRLVVEGYAVEYLAAKRATACGITAEGEVACAGGRVGGWAAHYTPAVCICGCRNSCHAAPPVAH